MNTRSVTIGICATVVGVMVGTVAIGFAEDLSLDGAIGYRKSANKPGIEFRARHIVAPPSTRNGTGLQSSTSSVASQATAEPVTVCSAVRSALDELAAVQGRVIPVNQANTAMRLALAKAHQDLKDKYCAAETHEAAPEASSAPSASKEVDTSHCDRYPSGTMRYVDCVIQSGGSVN